MLNAFSMHFLLPKREMGANHNGHLAATGDGDL